VAQTSHVLASAKAQNGVLLEVRHGDLCRERVDAIVNAANERMMHGAGVARAIADAAGGGIVDRESAEWIRSNGLLVTGRMAAITSAGALPCKCVVHVTGPTQERDAPLLRSAVMAALNKAEEAECESIALPAISSGIFGFPLPLCAKILVECGMEFARGGPRFLRRIAYTNIDIKTATAMQKALEDYRPDEPGAARAAVGQGGRGHFRPPGGQVVAGGGSARAPVHGATCSVHGCDRVSWNGQPREECCRTCAISQGREHGPTCDTNHRARLHLHERLPWYT
jgi:O-acetyl-ADP-ribose deacetylase (regulator of RNase III)